MKKVLTYLSAWVAGAALVFSCSPLPEDNSHVDEVVKAPTVDITVSGIDDYSATVTIAPAGAAAYYSYVIDQSDEAAELDADALYAGKYSSVAQGLVKYDQSASTTVELEDLDPNTTYQVYAIAGSTTGVVGEIVVKSFTTGDTGNPAIDGIQRKGNAVSVAFNEVVKYNESKPATAKYYAYNLAQIEDGKLVSNGEMGDAHVEVSTSGNVVTFTVTLDGTNPLPDGAYFTIAYPEGAFVDALGNPTAAQNHLTGVTSAGELGFGGIYGRIPVKAFELVDDAEKAIVVPSEEYLVYGIPEGVQIAWMEAEAEATITAVSTTPSKNSTVEYKLAARQDWGYAQQMGGVVVFYPADFDISGGDNFTVKIAADSFTDIYGNGNAALEHSYLYSYNYKLEDIYGTYQNSGETIFSSKSDEDPWTFTISKTSDSSKGNVMISEYYGFDGLELYANFDVDKGELTFPVHYSVAPLGGVVVGQYFYDFSAWSYSSTQDAPNMTLYMTEAGKFTGGNDYPGYVVDVYAMPESGNVSDIDTDADYLGYDYNMFYPVFTKVEAAGSSQSAAQASIKAMPNLLYKGAKRISDSLK